jgi:alkanesulfonate monooxygenase SsuD/methylene tetrahydromethanopterin reductase-like flavin-dependent oxidoreductase (luciferase family)
MPVAFPSAMPTPGLAVQGGDLPLLVEAAIAAEKHGLASVWTSEFYDRSASVTLAAQAVVTSRIALGSSIAWAFGRTPLALATDFRSLDGLAPGRLSMGLGTGNPQVIGEWLGLDVDRPVARLLETVQLVRDLWQLNVKAVDHQGRHHRCRIDADPGLPALSTGTLPVLLAAGREPMLRAAGAVADGLVGMPMSTREFIVETVHPALLAGAREAGRTERIPVTGMVICSIADDSARARAAAAVQIAVYTSRRSTDPLLRLHGFEKEAEAVREAAARRDIPGMAAAVSDRMLDRMAVYGTPEEARQRYQEAYGGVFEQPLLYASGKGVPLGVFRDHIHAICETFTPAVS